MTNMVSVIYEGNQLTQEQAVRFCESGQHVLMTDGEVVELQLYQEFLCVPPDRYHCALASVIDRAVNTIEFTTKQGIAGLRSEYEALKGKSRYDKDVDKP